MREAEVNLKGENNIRVVNSKEFASEKEKLSIKKNFKPFIEKLFYEEQKLPDPEEIFTINKVDYIVCGVIKRFVVKKDQIDLDWIITTRIGELKDFL